MSGFHRARNQLSHVPGIKLVEKLFYISIIIWTEFYFSIKINMNGYDFDTILFDNIMDN